MEVRFSTQVLLPQTMEQQDPKLQRLLSTCAEAGASVVPWPQLGLLWRQAFKPGHKVAGTTSISQDFEEAVEQCQRTGSARSKVVWLGWAESATNLMTKTASAWLSVAGRCSRRLTSSLHSLQWTGNLEAFPWQIGQLWPTLWCCPRDCLVLNWPCHILPLSSEYGSICIITGCVGLHFWITDASWSLCKARRSQIFKFVSSSFAYSHTLLVCSTPRSCTLVETAKEHGLKTTAFYIKDSWAVLCTLGP